MRSPLRIAAIIFVIVSGLAGSYFIIKNSGRAVPVAREETQKLSELSNKLFKETPLIWKEKLADLAQNLSENPEGVSQEANQDISSVNKHVNLTELVAKSLFGQMKNL